METTSETKELERYTFSMVQKIKRGAVRDFADKVKLLPGHGFHDEMFRQIEQLLTEEGYGD